MKKRFFLMGIACLVFIVSTLHVFPVYAKDCEADYNKCLTDGYNANLGDVKNEENSAACDKELVDCQASNATVVPAQGGGTSPVNYNNPGDKYGLKQTAGVATLPQNDDLTGQIGTIISKLLEYIAVIFFLLMLYGGFLWMTSAGANEKVTKAKGLIVNAILGLVIISAAYAITNFVIGAIG